MSSEIREMFNDLPVWRKKEIDSVIQEFILTNSGTQSPEIDDKIEKLRDFLSNKLEKLFETQSRMQKGFIQLEVLQELHDEGIIDQDKFERSVDRVNMEYVTGSGRGFQKKLVQN